MAYTIIATVELNVSGTLRPEDATICAEAVLEDAGRVFTHGVTVQTTQVVITDTVEV